MQKEKHWNIWRIKNRWLRAFAVALIGTPYLIAAALLVAVLSVVIGAGEGLAKAWSIFRSEQDGKVIYRNYWRAITMREAP